MKKQIPGRMVKHFIHAVKFNQTFLIFCGLFRCDRIFSVCRPGSNTGKPLEFLPFQVPVAQAAVQSQRSFRRSPASASGSQEVRYVFDTSCLFPHKDECVLPVQLFQQQGGVFIIGNEFRLLRRKALHDRKLKQKVLCIFVVRVEQRLFVHFFHGRTQAYRNAVFKSKQDNIDERNPSVGILHIFLISESPISSYIARQNPYLGFGNFKCSLDMIKHWPLREAPQNLYRRCPV